MKRYILILILGLFLGGVCCGGDLQTAHVVLSSLEWPPYTSGNLPGNGASGHVVTAAFRAAGVSTDLGFYPWKRAVRMAEKGRAAAYFPEYFSPRLATNFIFSEKMGTSPLGFIEPANNRVNWDSLSDLKGLRIGVVDGYVNTPEFDNMVALKELTVDPGVDDMMNIKKLALGRLDLAVMDRNVFEYLMKTAPCLAPFKDKIVFNKKLLGIRGLYVCFPRSDGGRKLLRLFNRGLSKIDWMKEQQEYMQSISR